MLFALQPPAAVLHIPRKIFKRLALSTGSTIFCLFVSKLPDRCAGKASSLLAEPLNFALLVSATKLPHGVQEEEPAQQPKADQGNGIEMEQDFDGTLEDMPQDNDGAGSEAEDGEEDRLQQVGTEAPMQACHQSQFELHVHPHEWTARGRSAGHVSSSLHRGSIIMLVCGGYCL